MMRRDEFAHLSDFELAARSVRVEAEVARLEAAELHGAGFEIVPVVGSGSLFWERGGRTYTHAYALAEIRAIPEIKEDSP